MKPDCELGNTHQNLTIHVVKMRLWRRWE